MSARSPPRGAPEGLPRFAPGVNQAPMNQNRWGGRDATSGPAVPRDRIPSGGPLATSTQQDIKPLPAIRATYQSTVPTDEMARIREERRQAQEKLKKLEEEEARLAKEALEKQARVIEQQRKQDEERQKREAEEKRQRDSEEKRRVEREADRRREDEARMRNAYPPRGRREDLPPRDADRDASMRGPRAVSIDSSCRPHTHN